MGGGVESPVVNEGEEEKRSLVKLERPVVLEHVEDTIDERRFGRVEPLQGLNGDWSRHVS